MAHLNYSVNLYCRNQEWQKYLIGWWCERTETPGVTCLVAASIS